MWEGDFGTLPVMADAGKVIGMITDRDIAIAVATRGRVAGDIAVTEAMSKHLYACSPGDDIHAALKTMRKDKVRRLPVINDDGRLVGVLSLNDIALHAEKIEGRKSPDLSYDDVVNTLKAICEHHPSELAGEQVRKVSAE
jgi:CBS-domain-containing membrane protein